MKCMFFLIFKYCILFLIFIVTRSCFCRILAFSIALIKIVEVQLDDEPWSECEHVKGPLYVLRWNTTDYRKGIHTIRV